MRGNLQAVLANAPKIFFSAAQIPVAIKPPFQKNNKKRPKKPPVSITQPFVSALNYCIAAKRSETCGTTKYIRTMKVRRESKILTVMQKLCALFSLSSAKTLTSLSLYAKATAVSIFLLGASAAGRSSLTLLSSMYIIVRCAKGKSSF